uniref:Uncharacterized protein n=1 Tax=Knipowitschia caucasica TaxID=637954 RepID=A0AAV2M6A4_KNICA
MAPPSLPASPLLPLETCALCVGDYNAAVSAGGLGQRERHTPVTARGSCAALPWDLPKPIECVIVSPLLFVFVKEEGKGAVTFFFFLFFQRLWKGRGRWSIRVRGGTPAFTTERRERQSAFNFISSCSGMSDP